MANAFGSNSTSPSFRPTSNRGQSTSSSSEPEIPKPLAAARPQVDIDIILPGNKIVSVGSSFSRVEFTGMMNSGYIFKAKLYDAHFNMYSQLIENNYFTHGRNNPTKIEFSLKHGPDADNSRKTKRQTAILVSLEVTSRDSDKADVEITAIDPPSYFLSAGTCSGEVITGRMSEAIQEVLDKIGNLQTEVALSSDSTNNKWYMMRQDPKTFISSLLEWSSGLTTTKTNWITSVDGFRIRIKDQGSIESAQRAFYKKAADAGQSSIYGCSIVSDHSLSILQTKLITHGVSAVKGIFYDKETDTNQNRVYVKEKTTKGKKVATLTGDYQSYVGPSDQLQPPYAGFTSIQSIPELNSSGGLGLDYDSYIDGRARKLFLETNLKILNARFKVVGHEIWTNTFGLGNDTIYIKWTKGKTDLFPDGKAPEDTYWLTGNWLVYGFHHILTRGTWTTDLYCSRYDKVGE